MALIVFSSLPDLTSHPAPYAETDSKGIRRVLMCRRGIEPRVGMWGFPQGFLEIGETTREGAARETMEEAGATVQPGPMLACYNLPGQVQLLYMATFPPARSGDDTDGDGDGEQEPPPEVDCGEESLEARFFAFNELPDEEELAFPTVKWALDYAVEVALPCLTPGGDDGAGGDGDGDGNPRWVTGFVPQQRTKLFFGPPADGGVGYIDETTAS